MSFEIGRVPKIIIPVVIINNHWHQLTYFESINIRAIVCINPCSFHSLLINEFHFIKSHWRDYRTIKSNTNNLHVHFHAVLIQSYIRWDKVSDKK
jgi:hypothetical protein